MSVQTVLRFRGCFLVDFQSFIQKNVAVNENEMQESDGNVLNNHACGRKTTGLLGTVYLSSSDELR